MLKSGMSLMDSVAALSHQEDEPVLTEILVDVCNQLASGYSFSRCLHPYGRCFSPVYVTMIKVGEQSGGLDDSLEKLADWLEKDFELVRKIRSSLTYPAFVLTLTLAVTFVLFYTVLPGFVEVLRQMGADLPLSTRLMFVITGAVANPGVWLMAVTCLVCGVAVVRQTLRNPQGAARIYRFLMALPVVGPLLRFSSASRYSAVVGTLLSSGLDLTVTLKLAARASGNTLIAQDAARLVHCVVNGDLISTGMETRPDIYPDTLRYMVAVGEETSSMAEMFGHVSWFYDEEVEYRVEALGVIIEPLLLGFLALIVGFVVVSVFFPLYSYLGQVGV